MQFSKGRSKQMKMLKINDLLIAAFSAKAFYPADLCKLAILLFACFSVFF